MAIDFNGLALAPCIAAFGVPVIYQPAAGAPVTISGIFNEFAQEDQLDTSTELMVTKQRPIVTINQADLPANAAPAQDEGIVVSGTTWAISDVMPDGLGAITLHLRRPYS